MCNIKFIKDPAYIYDLIFVFTLYFNRDYCLAHFINYDKSSEDTEYYKGIISEFSPISDELLPFFRFKDNKKNFFSQFYFDAHKDSFPTTFSLRTLKSALSDYDSVITNLIQYYFPDTDAKALTANKNSIIEIGRLIRNSTYSNDIKSSLYGFFIDPVFAIQKLIDELMSKEHLLEQKYKNSYRKICDLQHEFNFCEFADRLSDCPPHKADFTSFDNIFVSFSLIGKNLIKAYYYDDKCVILLGYDYVDCMEFMISDSKLPELDIFGNAISEKNRVEILNLIMRKGEITIRDLEQELKLTGTNAYYHLSLMIKANMIRTRNQGRTIYYSINGSYFNKVCDMLREYINPQ